MHKYIHTYIKSKGRTFLHSVRWQACRCFLNHFYLFALRKGPFFSFPYSVAREKGWFLSFLGNGRSCVWRPGLVSMCCLSFCFHLWALPADPCWPPAWCPWLPPCLFLRVPFSRPQRFLLPNLSFACLCCVTPRLC